MGFKETSNKVLKSKHVVGIKVFLLRKQGKDLGSLKSEWSRCLAILWAK